MKEQIGVQSTVLLVDDEPDFLDLVRICITPYFSTVLSATSGEEAVKVLKTQSVNSVVTDYFMPGMTGLGLIAYIRAYHPLVPVIMLTGNSGNQEVVAALREGAFDVLDKPFRAEVLVNRIQNSLILPHLVSALWASASQEMGLPAVEEFLRKPFPEQLKLIHAYTGLLKLRGLSRSTG